ncbi:MAG: chromosomal replication initiator protein DnaA [Actinobacteria bacterium]|nr:MAG: chromosomal replication initiator protein DnaA [Actinomycetota bacterium]
MFSTPVDCFCGIGRARAGNRRGAMAKRAPPDPVRSALARLRIAGDTMVLAVPSAFAKKWLEDHYAGALADALGDSAGRPLALHVTVDPARVAPIVVEPAPAPAPAAELPRRSAISTPLNPKYTFDTFVIGPSNRFPHAAALAVAEQPARSYNPLFIYGGAGLGKTHLLHAIGHHVLRLYPSAVTRYVSSEQFMNEFIMGVREEKMPAFRHRYREADVLLVDDIQFMARGEQTQEEFFHTFNALYNDGRQIAISSDRAPNQIAGLEDRLRSRFEWGLITDVTPPDLETRVAILQKKAQAEGFAVPDDVLEYIAQRVQNNIRELEGRLTRVVACASLSSVPVTLDLAQDVLRPLLPSESAGDIPSELIITETAEYYTLTRADMIGPSRSRPLVTARQVAMYLCRELTPLSLPKIGEVFGGRDHTTVMHANDKIKKLMLERAATYSQVQELTARIRRRVSGGDDG